MHTHKVQIDKSLRRRHVFVDITIKIHYLQWVSFTLLLLLDVLINYLS